MIYYKIIKGSEMTYVENQINYYSDQYEDFKIYGGINNYGGYFTVLVSYIK